MARPPGQNDGMIVIHQSNGCRRVHLIRFARLVIKFCLDYQCQDDKKGTDKQYMITCKLDELFHKKQVLCLFRR